MSREVDKFFIDLARQMPSNKNVELGGRDGFKFFKHGVTSYMLPKVRRINGGWWISIARQLKLFFCITKIVSDTTRAKFCDALSLLFEVHHPKNKETGKKEGGVIVLPKGADLKAQIKVDNQKGLHISVPKLGAAAA